MKHSLKIAITLVMFAAQACAIDATMPEPDLEPQAEALEVDPIDPALDGVWRTHCEVGATHSLRREMQVCNGSVYFIEYAYADDRCDALSSSVSYESLVESRSADLGDGVRQLRQTLLAVVMTPLDAESAERFDAQSECDRASWSVGEGFEMMGCMDAAAEPRIDALYRIDGEQLSFTTGSYYPAARGIVDAPRRPTGLIDGTATAYFRRPGPAGFCD